HFEQSIHALCNIQALLSCGISCHGDRSEEPEESFTFKERHRSRIFQALLQLVPGLEE
ncbi:hypothetical protein SERLA73DRAFT_39073, partial [Serpula lacrymans var. lacrymans S7.3]